MKKIYRYLGLVNLLILFFFIIDRILKWLVLNLLPPEGVNLGGRILKIEAQKNYNLAFGFALPPTLIYIMLGVILFILILYLIKNYRQQNIFLILAITLIIGGAFSNLIDRFRFGYVIDYISFAPASFVSFFPIFNFADIMIVVGVGLWIVKEFIQKSGLRMF